MLELPTGRVHLRRVPDGSGREPAVFVHGLGGSATNWTDLAWLLADRVDGVAVDLPGFGGSDPPGDGDYNLSTHVRAVTAAVRAVGSPAHLFGNSLGGAVCVRLAAEHPELVRSLTLVSPALPDRAFWRFPDPRLALLVVPGLRSFALRRMASVPPEHRAGKVASLCYAHPQRIPAVRLAELAGTIRERDRLAWSGPAMVGSLAGLVRAQFGRRGLWHDVAAIRAPTLIVWGRHDRLVHHSVGRRAARAIPGARLLILSDCGHVAQLEAPERVAGAWLEFTTDPSSEKILSLGADERGQQ
jgi:pimeloyl-ACP methyl ester carboxylesterase